MNRSVLSLAQEQKALKSRIKAWEGEFRERCGRRPEKRDVEEDGVMKDEYVRYEELRAALQSQKKTKSRSMLPTNTMKQEWKKENAIANVARKPDEATLPVSSDAMAALVRKADAQVQQYAPKRKKEVPSLEQMDLEFHAKDESLSTSKQEVVLKQPKPASKRKTKRKAEKQTQNYVKLDLKNGYGSKKPKTLPRIVKNFWVSKKQYILDKKIQQSEERNENLYTELIESFEDDITIEDPIPKQLVADDATMDTMLKRFGHTSFREGQRETISYVLNGQSTLLILPTGGGKSLCYQMAAALSPGLALIITPLISLVQDQLLHMPSFIRAGSWTSQDSSESVASVIRSIRQGTLDLLFVSPERLFTPGFFSIMTSLPPQSISFVCIDEAHCVSEWSHNFRPCYLRVKEAVQLFGVKTILGLTATATAKTEESICSILHISPDHVVRMPLQRSNLHLSSSRDHNQKDALLRLLQSPRYRDLGSIIVYVATQRSADEIASFLLGNNLSAGSYHAGKFSDKRRQIQTDFMENKVRIIVATVAFGMGLDKSDVRAVLHFNAPRSMEHYVQEIGRAGRDGLVSYCHTFYNDEDVSRFRSLVYSDGIELKQVELFLHNIFGANEAGQYKCLSLDSIASKMDMRAEVIETMLVKLLVNFTSSDGQPLIEILPNLHTCTSMSFHNTKPEKLATVSTLVRYVVENLLPKQGKYFLHLDHVANGLGWDMKNVQQSLMEMKKNGEVRLQWRHWGFCIKLFQNVDAAAFAPQLHDVFLRHEQIQLGKTNLVAQVLKAAASNTLQTNAPNSSFLHDSISTYFETKNYDSLLSTAESRLDERDCLSHIMNPSNVPSFLESDIKLFIHECNGKHTISSGRQIARIFHGIGSPQFPIKSWKKSPWWRKHLYFPFESTREIAQSILDARFCKNALPTKIESLECAAALRGTSDTSERSNDVYDNPSSLKKYEAENVD